MLVAPLPNNWGQDLEGTKEPTLTASWPIQNADYNPDLSTFGEQRRCDAQQICCQARCRTHTAKMYTASPQAGAGYFACSL